MKEKKEVSNSIKFLRALIDSDEEKTAVEGKSSKENLKNFLEKTNGKKRIIITDDVQNVNNAIFRICKDGNMISNANVVNIIDIAKEIVMNNVLSDSNADIDSFKYLNRDSAVSIMGKILNEKKDKITFVSEDSFCTATYREIYDNINLIRLNENENYNKIASSLKKDLDLLIKAYNKELCDNQYYDDARIILEANDYVKENYVNEKNEVYGLIDFNHSFSKFEMNLINKLLGTSKEVLEIDKNKKIEGAVFKESYGYYDEVNEALLDLINKNISETLILYTDDIYYPYIKSVFGNAGIETSFTTGYNASNISFVKNIRYLLDFAINNYNYKDLKPLCLSNSMTFNNVQEKKEETSEEEKDKKSKKYISLIKEFEKGIGLGISCKLAAYKNFEENDYKDFIKKHYFIEDIDDNNKHIISEEYYKFIKEIISAFKQYDKNKSLSILLINLMKFVDKYKVKHSEALNKHNQTIKSKLYEMSESLKLMSIFNDVREGLKYLDSLLEKLTIADQYEHGTIEVQKLNTTKVFNKKNIYILGLTAKQYLGNNAESPVLSDETRKEFCEYNYESEKYNLHLTCDEEKMRKEYLFDTCDYLFDDSNINVYCSKFDQIANYPLSRAPIFNQLMKKYNSNDSAPSVFKYPIFENEYSFDANKEMDAIKDEMEENSKKEKMPKNKNLKEENAGDHTKQNDNRQVSADGNDESEHKPIVISHSALSQFLNCQVQYYYSHILHLSDENYTEMDHDKWIDPLKRGSIIHEILQKYVEKVFITNKTGANGKKYGKKINEKEFNDICKEVFEKYDNIQSASDFVKKKTIDDIKKKLNDYLSRMHQEFSDPSNEWYVEKCEVSFDAESDEKNNSKTNKTANLVCFQEFDVKGGDSQKKEEREKKEKRERIYFRGRIDRIDKSKNDDNKIRIIDYKTGNHLKFIEKMKDDRQHHIYALCFTNDGKKEVEFRYEFIDYDDYKKSEDDPIIKKFDIAKVDLKNPMKQEEFDALKSLINGKTELSSLKYVKSRCTYCKYADICILKLSASK